MPAPRYIRPLTLAEVGALKRLYRRTDNADLRSRCQTILLLAEGHSIADIARLTFFDEDAVRYWFEHYEAEKLTGLEDRPRSGRPPKDERRPDVLSVIGCSE